MLAIQNQPVETHEMFDEDQLVSMHVEHLVSQFDSITLSEMNQVALLDRIDTKYVMGISQLYAALEQITDQYRVLCVDHTRLNHYQTLYFDTEDFVLYHQHHNGLRSRHKVRVREYTDSDLAFWEVKHKTNQNRTVKSRYQIFDPVIEMDDPVDEFIESHMPFDADQLEPKLWSKFQRITLVSKQHAERLTLDINLAFGWGDAYASLPGIAIAEVKQERFSQASDFIQQMRQLGVRPTRFSKYCAGVYMLYDNVKVNNFKPRIRLVNALMQKESA